jgi:TolA-binding protein
MRTVFLFWLFVLAVMIATAGTAAIEKSRAFSASQLSDAAHVRPNDPTKSGEKHVKADGLLARVTALEKQLQEAINKLEKTETDLRKVQEQVIALINDLDKNAIKYGSQIRLQVKNEEWIAGTDQNKATGGTVINLGGRGGNDNWFTVDRRPGK